MDLLIIDAKADFWPALRSLTQLTVLSLHLDSRPPYNINLQPMTGLVTLKVVWPGFNERETAYPLSRSWSAFQQLSTLYLSNVIIDHPATQALANLPHLEDLLVRNISLRGQRVVCERACAWKQLHLRHYLSLKDILALTPLKDSGVKVTVHMNTDEEPVVGGYQIFGEDQPVPADFDLGIFQQQMRVLRGCLVAVNHPIPLTLTNYNNDGIGLLARLPSGIMTAMAPLVASGFFDQHQLEFKADMDRESAMELVRAFPALVHLDITHCCVEADAWLQLHALKALQSITIQVDILSDLCYGAESLKNCIGGLQSLAFAMRRRRPFRFVVRASRDKKRAAQLEKELMECKRWSNDFLCQKW